MYETFFGLTERPFQLTPNPRYLFLNPSHREALATLRDGLSAPRGVTLLLGEAGTGKTTLLMAAMRLEKRPTHRFVLVSNPTLKRDEFYEYLSGSFRLPGAGGSKARFLLDFQQDVADHAGRDGLTAIVIDEAQSLSHELLEEVRLLANLETETTKLVNVVLVGQQELAARLNQPELRQLKQRVGLRCALQPLDLRETACYIAARLRTAGADASEVFTRDAVLAVYEASRGIPRTIGVICDNALIGGYAAQVKPVTRDIVEDVCRDFDLVVEDEVAGERRTGGAGEGTPGRRSTDRRSADVVAASEGTREVRRGPAPAARHVVEDDDEDEVEAPPPRVGYRGRRIFPD